MPITGFLAGVNEQLETNQKLQDQYQLSQLRATEVAMGVERLRADAAVKGTLAQIFTSDATAGPQTEEALASKYDRAAMAITPIAPAQGLAFANASAAIKQKQALQRKEALDAQAKARDEQGGYLFAMKDQDSYDILVPKAIEAGWKIPSWFTGDWTKDGPRIAAEAAGTMKASEQSNVQAKAATAEIRLQDLARKSDQAASSAEMARLRLEETQRRNDETARKNDQIAAAKQSNLERQIAQHSIASRTESDRGIDVAKAVVESMPNPPKLSPGLRSEIGRRAADMAKRDIMKGADEDFDTLVRGHVEEILASEIEPGKPKKYGLPFTDIFDFTLGEGEARLKTKPPKAAAPTARTDASGGTSQLPKVGEVRKGYRFKGGDPSKATSWEKV